MTLVGVVCVHLQKFTKIEGTIRSLFYHKSISGRRKKVFFFSTELCLCMPRSPINPRKFLVIHL